MVNAPPSNLSAHRRLTPYTLGLDSMDKVRPGKWERAHAGDPYARAREPARADATP